MNANRLLTVLRRVLDGYRTSQDPAALLVMETLDLAARLVDLVETGSDIRDEALAAAGQLHWYRALLLPAPDDGTEIDLALELFSKLDPARVDLLPTAVRQLLSNAEGKTGDHVLGTLRRLELCRDLLDEYRKYADPEALLTAIAFLEQIRRAAADPLVAELYAEFGELAREAYEQYQHTGEAPSLDHAILLARASVSHQPAYSAVEGARLSNLSLMLRDRYERGAHVADLDEAISVGRAAIRAVGKNKPTNIVVAANLGLILLSRFRHDRSLAGLNEAIYLMELAVAEPGRHRGRYLSNLAVALRARHDANGEPADMNRAVSAAEAAVDETGLDDPDRSRHLSNLASVYRDRFHLSGDSEALNAAVDAVQTAVELTAPSDPNRGRYLSNLAVTLGVRYNTRATQEKSTDRDDAIEAATAAIRHTAADHPDRADRLATLATLLLPDERRHDMALELLREAAQQPDGRVVARIAAAQSWARAAASLHDFTDALAGYTVAVSLLPMLVSREIIIDRDRAFRISGVLPGLTADAVASALHCNEPVLALKLWEQGRGVLLDQELQLRSDISELAGAEPELAGRLLEIGNLLGARAPGEGHPATEIDRRLQLAHDWDNLVAQARSIDGFADFLRGPQATELLRAGNEGPVVLLNVSRYRSDALVIFNEELIVVPLPEVTPARVRAATSDFSATSTGLRASAALAWLWTAITEPVLTSLGVTDVADGDPMRLWWCPTGELALLPLHAAGPEDASRRSVLDLVTVSYTPTVRALLQARERPSVHLNDARALAISMPHTPGLGIFGDLPHALSEAEVLARTFPNARSLIGEDATVSAVLNAIGSTDIVHFACHGFTDLTDPSASGLQLADGRLRVADVMRRRLELNPTIVLSSCSTAASGASTADEPVNLASAFLLAGGQHIVGTLWWVDDRIAAETVERLYAALSQHGWNIANALKDAVRQMRDLYPDDARLWSSFIHTGP